MPFITTKGKCLGRWPWNSHMKLWATKGGHMVVARRWCMKDRLWLRDSDSRVLVLCKYKHAVLVSNAWVSTLVMLYRLPDLEASCSLRSNDTRNSRLTGTYPLIFSRCASSRRHNVHYHHRCLYLESHLSLQPSLSPGPESCHQFRTPQLVEISAAERSLCSKLGRRYEMLPTCSLQNRQQ